MSFRYTAVIRGKNYELVAEDMIDAVALCKRIEELTSPANQADVQKYQLQEVGNA